MSFSYSLRSPYKVKIAVQLPKLVHNVPAKQQPPGCAGSTRNPKRLKMLNLKPSNVPGLQKLVPGAGIGLKINFVTFTTNNHENSNLNLCRSVFLDQDGIFSTWVGIMYHHFCCRCLCGKKRVCRYS